jgi:2,4-dienoyl-CoA reductase-like NADH-dependent reductase (Old Yellow Enzyme family)
LQAGLIVFGSSFLPDSDLVTRMQSHAPLNTLDRDTFYTPGVKGRMDYPALAGCFFHSVRLVRSRTERGRTSS